MFEVKFCYFGMCGPIIKVKKNVRYKGMLWIIKHVSLQIYILTNKFVYLFVSDSCTAQIMKVPQATFVLLERLNGLMK